MFDAINLALFDNDIFLNLWMFVKKGPNLISENKKSTYQ